MRISRKFKILLQLDGFMLGFVDFDGLKIGIMSGK